MVFPPTYKRILRACLTVESLRLQQQKSGHNKFLSPPGTGLGDIAHVCFTWGSWRIMAE